MGATRRVARDTVVSVAFDPLAVRRWVERSCAAQGVPVEVTDPSVLARVVVLLGGGRERVRKSRAVVGAAA
jgi:hypothetical protein